MDPEATAELAIPFSKWKIALVLLGSLAFMGGGFFLWFVEIETETDFDALTYKVAILAVVCFSGFSAIYSFIKLFNSKPGLIINSMGIVDNASGVSVGLIPWSEVTGLKVSSIQLVRFLTIEVVDTQKYIERGGWFKRMLNAGNMWITGSPINISSLPLSVKFDELVRVVTEALKDARARAE